jgi:hypothetical protein
MVDVSIHARERHEVYGSARVVTPDMQTCHTEKQPAYAELTLRVGDATVHLYVNQAAGTDTLRALDALRACVEQLMREPSKVPACADGA